MPGKYPIGRCNNCYFYFHDEDELDAGNCPKCKTDDYLMDMPEIAAAPDLLHAANNALNTIEGMVETGVKKGSGLPYVVNELRLAIDKAKGGK